MFLLIGRRDGIHDIYILISIHLMFLLIGETAGSVIAEINFNTSHVSINQRYTQI